MLQSSKALCISRRILRICLRTISSTQQYNAQPKREERIPENEDFKDNKLASEQDKTLGNSLHSGVGMESSQSQKDLGYFNALESKGDVPAEVPSMEVGFWQTERGLELKEQIFTLTGRVARMFFPKERYDNLYEAALEKEKSELARHNEGDEETLRLHGPEWAMGQVIFSLGGAVKLRYDDRWVEDVRCLRTPKRRDFRLEGIDVRNSAINHLGLKYLSRTQHVRYFNAGDAKHFDDQAMACLHPLADSLEFLDISGTAVTERGFGYMRLFSKLRFLNLSRLEKAKNLENLLPFLLEILPEGCCVLTTDETPSNMYGHPIPFRHPLNYKKDLPVMEGNKSIGDLITFKEEMMEIDLHRPETIHEIWMTPVIGTSRKSRMIWQSNLDNTFSHKLVKYILKANNYKPLL